MSKKDWHRPNVKAAFDAEFYNRLNFPRPHPDDPDNGVFGMKEVREWRDVRSVARQAGVSVRRVFGDAPVP